MKTQKEIEAEIAALKAVRPKVWPQTLFGDNNLTALDAQIEVLEQGLDEEDIYDRFDVVSSTDYILESALAAYDWVGEKNDYEDGGDGNVSLAAEWPLKSEENENGKNPTTEN